MEKLSEPKKWTKNGFVAHLADFDKRMKDRALAFIIGSGASQPSGIKTGGDLVCQWLKEIHLREDFDKLSLEDWAKPDTLGIPDFEYSRAAEFYSEIFQRRYAHDREEGFAFLEETMEEKEPSLGYSILAELLSQTRHKVVVTTNFDNLVADALAIHARKHALVCGHESLAGFIRPHLRRPLVAKIHRDLFLAPKNDPVGVGCLEDGWTTALTRLFEHYTPVVIGYGGNDGSLMGFLEKAQLRGGLWWCYRSADGKPVEKVRELVAKKQGRLIPIIGFDEFMLEVGAKLIPNFDITEIGSRIEGLGKERARRYRDEASKLYDRINKADADKQVELEPTRKALQATTEQPRNWWGWELKARAEADPVKREDIYLEGLRHCKDSADLTGNFAVFMVNIRKDYDEAERLYRKALELDLTNAITTGNFALFMHHIRKDYDEAERLYRKALELDPTNAITTGNFALFMHHIRKDYDEAERLYRKALELDPTNANTTGSFALFMHHTRKDYDEAERLYRKTLELEPANANTTGSFALFMHHIRKDYDEAERLYRKALELDPTNANTTGSFALFMDEIRKDYDEAERLHRKTLELEPANANTTCNYAGFLLSRGRWDESRQYADLAETLVTGETSQTTAELLFYRVLLTAKQGDDPEPDLVRLKSLLSKGFLRGKWSFDSHLEAMAPFLDEVRLKFFRAVADAILDEKKVSDLETFSEWQAI